MQHTSITERLRSSRLKAALVGLMFALALTIVLPAVVAQTYSILYNFTGQSDGANPIAGVTLDRSGNLYGTASAGGSGLCNRSGLVGCGTAYKLTRAGTGWTFAPLHEFSGGADGTYPAARVVFGPNGALFGTTVEGGLPGYGTVFELQPPTRICPTLSCPWTERILYSFRNDYGDGADPGGGDLVFDAQGNLYGTTQQGDGYLCDDGPCGTVYELSPNQGGWNETVFQVFGGGISCDPYAGLVSDGAGNFYGVTPQLAGGIYELSNGVGISLYYFSQLSEALGGLTLDSAGNLYGTTSTGGSGSGGTVFKFNVSNSHLTTLYSFSGSGQNPGPTSTLLMDAAGNLYGITHLDGAHQQGSVFKLTQSNGAWSLTTLHDFTGGADGGQPFGQLTMDASGNIYGTTQVGGSSVGNCYQGLGCGVVFEITP